ncbi:MAG: phosphoesterase [Oscillospiraceae bacterium]|nr:phosphoesterase [Oscillospiraceae bacterium]
MAELYYDLHLHSCLSPCGDEEMTPQNIVGMMALAGYELIAVADHNSTRNCKAILAAAKEVGILAIPAMELCTREEVHVLCFLPDIEAAEAFGRHVYTTLPDVRNRSDIFGKQLLMDEQDQTVGEEERLLISAADIGIYEVYDLVRSYGGTAIPAHVDRHSFSLLSNLGFYDPTMQFPAMELTANCDRETFLQAHGIALRHMVNSDAHSLEQIPDPKRKICLQTCSARGVIQAIEASREDPGIFL